MLPRYFSFSLRMVVWQAGPRGRYARTTCPKADGRFGDADGRCSDRSARNDELNSTSTTTSTTRLPLAVEHALSLLSASRSSTCGILHSFSLAFGVSTLTPSLYDSQRRCWSLTSCRRSLFHVTLLSGLPCVSFIDNLIPYSCIITISFSVYPINYSLDITNSSPFRRPWTHRAYASSLPPQQRPTP